MECDAGNGPGWTLSSSSGVEGPSLQSQKASGPQYSQSWWKGRMQDVGGRQALGEVRGPRPDSLSAGRNEEACSPAEEQEGEPQRDPLSAARSSRNETQPSCPSNCPPGQGQRDGGPHMEERQTIQMVSVFPSSNRGHSLLIAYPGECATWVKKKKKKRVSCFCFILWSPYTVARCQAQLVLYQQKRMAPNRNILTDSHRLLAVCFPPAYWEEIHMNTIRLLLFFLKRSWD